MKKQFKELTAQGQKARLTKYAKQREELGTSNTLANLVRKPTIKSLDNGANRVSFRLAIYNAETEKTDFVNASAYINPEKVGGELESFYASLDKGQLVSVDYKMNGDFMNVWSMFPRERSAK